MSKLVAERGGFDLLPELGFKPVNKYLPPRPRRDASTSASLPKAAETVEAAGGSAIEKLFSWADKVLSR